VGKAARSPSGSERHRRRMELCAWNHTTAKQDAGSNLSGCGKCQNLCSGDLMTILFIIVYWICFCNSRFSRSHGRSR
jgi:hypothetical protein